VIKQSVVIVIPEEGCAGPTWYGPAREYGLFEDPYYGFSARDMAVSQGCLHKNHTWVLFDSFNACAINQGSKGIVDTDICQCSI
jgi:hypothetical protein